MPEEVVINYSLGSATRKKHQEMKAKSEVPSLPVETKHEYKPLTKKFIDASLEVQENGLPIIPILSKCLDVVFDAQDFMVDNFDKYKS